MAEGRAIRVEDLLREREARGLRWAIVFRFALLTMGALMVPVTSPTFADTVFTSFLLAVGFSICAYGYWLARRERRLRFVGWMCLSFDLVTLYTLPLSWYKAVGGAEMSPGFLLKNDAEQLALMLIAANGVSLRPLYPLIMTGASLLLYGGFLVYGFGDPRVVFLSDIGQSVMGVTVHPGLFGWKLLTIAFLGALFAWLAKMGRRTVREAVELEHANQEMRRRHAELITEGRLSALGGLVAGVAHEINTPLGVVKSSVQTIESGSRRISREGNERVLAVFEDNAETAQQAVDRISGLVGKLKDFAGLDQSEVQRLQLETALDRTIDLVDPSIKGESRIQREYQDVRPVPCRPKEINQVFYTLILNAFQAMNGDGALKVATSRLNGRAIVEIADNGRGIDPRRLSGIFDIQFADKQERVGMGLGLPMAHHIVETHGGSITVESEVGQGTSFRIELPAS